LADFKYEKINSEIRSTVIAEAELSIEIPIVVKVGNAKKEKNLLSFADKEHRYIKSKLHQYSRMLIDLCVRYGVGNLILVNQEAKEAGAQSDSFLLRNWGYFGLKELIKYKADIAGVNLLIE